MPATWWGLDTYEADELIEKSSVAANQRASALPEKTWSGMQIFFPEESASAQTAEPAWDV